MEKSKLKIWELALLLALCVTLCYGVFLQARQTALEEKVIRLHVIAADDSETEQAVKLQVRDAVLAALEPLTGSAASAEEARAAIEGGLDEIEKAAASAAGGRPVELLFGQVNYPTRYAEGCALPAGTYCSLRVILGQGQGHNWWGVIFPDLTDFSTRDWADAAKLLGEEDFALLCDEGEGVQIRFRFLEWLAEVRSWFR
ncbi:MAG: stage II sporulation protein R [Oscillospiraceae bacterium]